MKIRRLKNTYFISGVILFGILIIVALLMNLKVLYLSSGAESLVSMVFGGGGIILVIVGIIKAIFQKEKPEI